MMDSLALLVVDDGGEAHTLKTALRRMGFEGQIIAAEDEQEGILLLGESLDLDEIPHLIICDLNKDHGAGRRILNWTKAQPRLAAVPFINVLSSMLGAMEHTDSERSTNDSKKASPDFTQLHKAVTMVCPAAFAPSDEPAML